MSQASAFNAPSPFLQFLQQNGQPSTLGIQPTDDDRIAFAQQQYPGGRLGTDSMGRKAWITGRTTVPLQYLTPPEFRGQQLPPLGLGALGRDVTEMQGAADRQFGRNQGQIDAVSGFLDQAPGAVQQGGIDNTQRMGDLSQMLQGLGANQAGDFQSFMSGVQGDVAQGTQQIQDLAGGVQQGLGAAGDLTQQGVTELLGRDPTGAVTERVDAGIAAMEDAASQFASSIRDYRNMAVQDAAITAGAIRASAHNAMKQATSGVNPDGTPMTSEQQADLKTQIISGANDQVQQAVVPIFSQYNQTHAALQGQLAQMRQAVGQAHFQGANLELSAEQLRSGNLQAALQGTGLLSNIELGKLQAGDLAMSALGLRAQVSTAMGDQYLRSQEGQRQSIMMSGQLEQSAASIRQAAILDATNLQLQGLGMRAQLVQQNPESVISYFQGLMALFNLSSAQAGRAIVQ